MSELLEKLGFKKRTHVGISLSANNFIELVCVDKTTKNVVRYASGNIKYNNAIREIIDYDEFIEVVEGLFAEAGLNPEECSVTLNLPNVHFGITQFETSYETPFIIENLQGEIEDLYIFKRNEPAISYSILPVSTMRNQQTVVFSAMQTKAIGRLIEIFDAMQVDLVRIDNSYSSLLKSLQFCDRFAKYFQKEEKTLVLLVTPNSCCSFYMNGNYIVDYFEEPLAVKSFSTDEVYSSIARIAKDTISKNNPMSVLLISETDEVNAEILSSRLEFSGETDFFNKSINSSDKFIDINDATGDVDENMISYLTIEAVGAAVADYDDYPLNINFVPAERINPNIINVGGYEVDLYRFIIILILGSALIAFIIGFSFKTILNTRVSILQNSTRQTQEQINVFKKQIDTNSPNDKKNIFPILRKIVDNNNAVLNSYVMLSTEIPANVYIKKFVSTPKGGIGILGEARTSELVDAFVKGLRENNPDLMVSKLSINSSDSIIPNKLSSGFTFEIKTSSNDVSLGEYDYNAVNTVEKAVSKAVKSKSSSSKKSSGSNSLMPPPPVI